MSHQPEGLNSAYVAMLLEQYLEAPSSVPREWRELFERRDPVAAPPPDVAVSATGNGRQATNGGAAAVAIAQPPVVAPPEIAAEPVAAPAPPVPESAAPAPAPVDEELLGGIAASMALVKAYRMHGHLAARLDPLGSEPPGDPALDEQRLVPPLTEELQARIPARLLRL